MNGIAKFIKENRKAAGLTQEEFASLMAYIRDNNIKAFITASNCSEIYGLWLKHRKRHGRIEISNE